VDLRDYVRLLRRRVIVIVVVVVACLAGAAAVTVKTTPTFQASSQVLLAIPGTTVTADTGMSGIVTNTSALAISYARLASVPQAVAAAQAAAGTSAAVSVAATAVPSTSLVTITVTSTSASAAQAVANAYPATFPGVLAQLNQIASAASITLTSVSQAALPVSPASPNVVVNLAIGFAVGLVLGLALAVAREALDRRIRDSRAIESRVGVSVLGVVPVEHGNASLPTVTHPDSARTEAYRKVRTNLLFSGPDGMVRTLCVTSALAEEGKSSLAVNLAVVCAQAGQRVALVDADLRAPSVHVKLGLSNETGLTSVLSEELALDDVIQQHSAGVTVVTAGPSPRDPSAMLENPQFRKVVAELESTHDVVILDTTPLLAVSDAAQVSSVCQGTIVVTRLRSTSFDALVRACATLEQVRTPVLGVVAVGRDEDPEVGYRYRYAPADQEPPTSHRRAGGAWRRTSSS
jgi:succinoglycan biosynthesis transport protein ExoP